MEYNLNDDRLKLTLDRCNPLEVKFRKELVQEMALVIWHSRECIINDN